MVVGCGSWLTKSTANSAPCLERSIGPGTRPSYPQILVEPSSGLSSVAVPVFGVILLGAKAALAVVIPKVAVAESALVT